MSILRLIAFLGVVAVLVAGGVWLADRPGSVSLLWMGWRVDTSVPMLLLALAVVAVVLYGIVHLIRFVLRVPALFARVRRERKLIKGYDALAEGYAALVAEDATKARKKAQEAARILSDPGPARVLLGRVNLMGADPDLNQAREANQGLLNDPATAIAGLRGLMEAAEAAGQPEDAAHYAEQVLARAPKAGWAARVLLRAQARAGRWAEAAATVEAASRSGALPAREATRLGLAVHLARLDLALERGETYEAVRFGKKALDLAPDSVAAVTRQARALAAEGNARKAVSLVESAWKKAPHAALGAAYMLLHAKEDALKRVSLAEALAVHHPDHLESRLLVAEMALTAKLWGQARSRLKPLVDGPLPADRRAALLMAAIEEGEFPGCDGTTAATHWLRAALALPASGGWTCGTCDTVAAEWAPTCPQCGGLATLAARSGPVAPGLPALAPLPTA